LIFSFCLIVAHRQLFDALAHGLQPLGKGQFVFNNGSTQQGEFVVDEEDSAAKANDEAKSTKTKWNSQSVVATASA
jgi:hypothetical protein